MNLGTHITSRINKVEKVFPRITIMLTLARINLALCVLQLLLFFLLLFLTIRFPSHRFKMLRVVANLLFLVVVATHVKAKDQKKGKFGSPLLQSKPSIDLLINYAAPSATWLPSFAVSFTKSYTQPEQMTSWAVSCLIHVIMLTGDYVVCYKDEVPCSPIQSRLSTAIFAMLTSVDGQLPSIIVSCYDYTRPLLLSSWTYIFTAPVDSCMAYWLVHSGISYVNAANIEERMVSIKAKPSEVANTALAFLSIVFRASASEARNMKTCFGRERFLCCSVEEFIRHFWAKQK